MIDKKLLAKLKKSYQANELDRRQINAASNNILFEAKNIIFAIQRNDLILAAQKLTALETSLKKIEKSFGSARLQKEGSYRAATEEYFEGRSLYDVIKDHRVNPVKAITLTHDDYLGGICDMIGELVRYATNQAASGQFDEAIKIKKLATDIMSQLADFDMTGYLRTKYDQARSHLRKLEQIAYEIKMRTPKS